MDFLSPVLNPDRRRKSRFSFKKKQLGRISLARDCGGDEEDRDNVKGILHPCCQRSGTSEAGTSHGTVNAPHGSAYDVFVSFRGPDTRYNITDVLYVSMTEKGIRVFRDTEEVRNGEAIGDELRRAVPDSRIYVVVFSKGYASSAWCLRELAMMVDCCRDPASRKVIWPIFYDVSPSDVNLQTDLYREDLEKHKEKYKEEDVKLWEEALEEVGRIGGKEYKGDKGMGEFLSAVVVDILKKLKIKDRRLPDQLLGMDDRVENVMGMLNLCSHVERQVVMVHGMGGLGKTTLANVIFNKISSRFDGCCFLADVRESLSTSVEGVQRLQKKLLKDIFGKSDGEIGDSSDGINEIQRRLRNRRVLIIFDDVSESSQLKKLVGNFDFFGPGTIIIITTRDKRVCEGLMRRPSVTAYEVEQMCDDHALQLFSRHAFDEEGPPNDFVDLSKRVIRMSGNLPLALEVIGGLLFRKDKNKWEHTLEKLERVPHKDVLNKLRISYDDLDESEKQIFLDIACFDHRVMPRRYASYMWEACGFFPNSGLDVLQNRSLIKVLNVDEDHDFKNKYWMHDLIREMGREIVSSEKSRLWDPELALNVIHQKQGTHQVLAIHLDGGYHFSTEKELILTGKEFEGMSMLRFLSLAGAGLSGEFKNLLWLRWDVKLYVRPNPYIFQMDSLVILQISRGGITDDSMKDMRMGNLRVLNIANTKNTRLPDLSRFPKLEIIDLFLCMKLKEIHSSVGVLRNLKRLNISNCLKLKRLPEELGSAKALQELSLIRCEGISELPESIGGLGNLRILRGIKTDIRKLPSSIGNLKNLEVLEITGFPHNARIPMSKLARCNLSGLASLRSLTLIGLNEDLEGIEKLYGLQKLKLKDVGGIVSTNWGSMSRLEDLDLHSRNISSAWQLPSSLRRLTLVSRWEPMQSGTSLDGRDNIEYMSYPIRLSDLGSLRRLCSLDLRGCERIDFFGVERMELLEDLTISYCGDFVGEVVDLSNLTRLKTVEFYKCNFLISVPRMAGDCHLKIHDCRESESFEGPYRQYHNKRKRRELEVE